jgi:hypothetical protein
VFVSFDLAASPVVAEAVSSGYMKPRSPAKAQQPRLGGTKTSPLHLRAMASSFGGESHLNGGADRVQRNGCFRMSSL